MEFRDRLSIPRHMHHQKTTRTTSAILRHSAAPSFSPPSISPRGGGGVKGDTVTCSWGGEGGGSGFDAGGGLPSPPDRLSDANVNYVGEGAISGAVNFVWEVLRFQLAATFPPTKFSILRHWHPWLSSPEPAKPYTPQNFWECPRNFPQRNLPPRT